MHDAVDRTSDARLVSYLGPVVFLATLGFAITAIVLIVGVPFGHEHDLLVGGGKVFSGSSSRERIVDIGIDDGHIDYLGIRRGVRSRDFLSARNLYVAPGFVDLECRAGAAGLDRFAELEERAVRQGVTTVVCGGDATLGPEEIRSAASALEGRGSMLNVAFLVGYDAVLESSPDDPLRVVLEGLEIGALGLAIGPLGPEGGDAARATLASLTRELDAIGVPWFGDLRNPIDVQLPYDGLGPGDPLPLTDGDPASDPRIAGEFARVLARYVYHFELIKPGPAIRRFTVEAADAVGLSDRSRVGRGAAADLVVFDRDRIRDRATWERPELHADGIVHVVVNGVPVIRDGELTGARPGRVLRRTAPASD